MKRKKTKNTEIMPHFPLPNCLSSYSTTKIHLLNTCTLPSPYMLVTNKEKPGKIKFFKKTSN